MPVLFLDRDGVINYNRKDHVKSWQEFNFLPGSLEALNLLHAAQYRVFVITNQAVVGRGILPQTTLDYIHSNMLAAVAQAGGLIEAVLSCTHCPEVACDCRKPQPGLIKLIENRFHLSAVGSWLIGDYSSDMAAGEQAGCRPLLVLTGRGTQTYQEYKRQGGKPNLTVKSNLLAAVKFILEEAKAKVNPLSIAS